MSCIPKGTELSPEFKAVLLTTTERMSSKALFQPCSCCRSVTSRHRNKLSNTISATCLLQGGEFCLHKLPHLNISIPALWPVRSALGQLWGALPAAASRSTPRSRAVCAEALWEGIGAWWGSGPGLGSRTQACSLPSLCRRVLLPGSNFKTGRVVICSA